MSNIFHSLNRCALLLGAGVALCASFNFAEAGKGFSTLYTFCHNGGSNCDDGDTPEANLVADSSGNLYGTTNSGGVSNQFYDCNAGCGVIFKMAPDGTDTTLYQFCATDCSDGASPLSTLVMDSASNLYGTTSAHGGSDGFQGGTIFKLAPNGTLTTLYTFFNNSAANGLDPYSGVIMDKHGNLYGTTLFGGNLGVCGGNGCGTVYEFKQNGVEKPLYSFQGGADGKYPFSSPIRDSSGAFYGTTLDGGNTNSSYCIGWFGDGGCGIVYKLAPDGTQTVLYTFCSKANCSDGANPYSPLVEDGTGNLYGTTYRGGVSRQNCDSGPQGYGCGALFEITTAGKYSVLYKFCSQAACTDGANPVAGLFLNKKDGSLYGTTNLGGQSNAGTVYKFAGGTETVLHSFDGSTNANPRGGAIKIKGYFYGTTSAGGNNNPGTVYKLSKSGG